MANTNAPKGFSPVGTVSGAAYNEQGRMYAIATDASNTYAIGDVVKVAGGSDANGIPYVTKLTNGAAGGDVPLGIVVGFRTADPGVSLVGSTLALEKTWLPLSSGTRYVFVVDDPNVVFTVQMDSTAIATTDLHKNAPITVTADQTSSLSTSAPYSNAVLTTPSTGSTNPVQLLGLYQLPNNAVGAYAVLLAKWNVHQYFGGKSGV